MKKWLLGLALWLGATALTPANATILFAGGEDIDFAASGNITTSTTAGRFRSAWARSCQFVNAVSGDSSFPPGNRIEPNTPFTASSDFWFHGQFIDLAASGGTTANLNWISFASVTDGVWRLALRGTGTNGQFKLDKRNAAGTVTNLATSASGLFTNAAIFQIDVHVVYAVSGSVDVYLNGSGTASLTYSGDTTTDSATQIADMSLSAISSVDGCWSEVVVSTTDTRTIGLLTIPPVANGNAMQWAGTNPCSAILNQSVVNDVNFIASTANNDLAQCTISPSIPTGTWAVEALVMATRALRSGTGPQNIAFSTRSAGTDYASGDYAPGASFGNIGPYIQSVNPATSNPFTTGELGTAGFNIGVKSRP